MNRRSLLNWFLSPSFDNYNMSRYDTENVARMICNEGAEQSVVESNNNYEHIWVPKIDVSLYREIDFLKPVAEIYDVLNDVSPKYIKHFLLHGSLADLTYMKGWSDLDTWVVVDDRIFDNPLELVGLRNLFTKLNGLLLKIDPIAHHGFIIVLESDLDHYDYSLMPLEVLKLARNIYGHDDVYVRKTNTHTDWAKKFQEIKKTFVEFESSGVFKHHPYKGTYLTKEMIEQNEGMYQFKYLIGTVMILPSIYYSAVGRPVYKANSFKAFLRDFPESSSLIRCISQIRHDWEEKEYPYVPNYIPAWVLGVLPKDYVSQIIKLLDDILENIKE